MMTWKRKKQITMSGLTHLAKDWIIREYKVHLTLGPARLAVGCLVMEIEN